MTGLTPVMPSLFMPESVFGEFAKRAALDFDGIFIRFLWLRICLCIRLGSCRSIV